MFDVLDKWNERVAFNEGYNKQRIASASAAGAAAFSGGFSKQDGRDLYMDSRLNLEHEAHDYLHGDITNGITQESISDVESEPIDDALADDDTANGWSMTTDSDGEVTVHNANAHAPDDGTVWDDEKGDFVDPNWARCSSTGLDSAVTYDEWLAMDGDLFPDDSF